MKLAFSTLGCPSWTLEHACAQARSMGYQGIELRLIDGAVVTVDPPVAQRESVAATLKRSGLEVTALATSVRLTSADADELRAALELAAHWSIPRVRVFGGHIEGTREAAVRRAASVVRAVLDDAQRLGCQIALETHDDFSAAAHVAEVIEAVGHPDFVAIWDLQHTWRAGDSPEQAWRALGPHTVEIQVKDGQPTADRGWRQTLLGDGEVPFRDCLALAFESGFDGWLVVEWEKHWQPEIAEPEVALPAHQAVLARLQVL